MLTLFLDGLFLKEDLSKDFNGKSSLDLIAEKSLKNDFDRIVLLQNGLISDIPDGIKNVIIGSDKDKLLAVDILHTIQHEMKNSKTCVIFNVGNPFYNPDFIDKMLERHINYIADYTYGIGYPKNLLPQVIDAKIVSQLIDLVKDDNEITDDYLFYAISKDINSYDIETFLSEIDLRMFRITIGASDRGEKLFTKNIYEQIGEKTNIDDIVHFIYFHLEVAFTLPYMVTLEITNYSQVNSIYFPTIFSQTNKKQFLSLDTIKKIGGELSNITNNLHIVLGGLGEPFEHPDIIEIINLLSNRFDLIVETFAYFDDSTLKELMQIKNKDSITFVINIDSFSRETYTTIHPNGGSNGNFENAESNIKKLNELGFRVYRKITRMIENEEEIEKAIREKKNENLIVGKYSTYCNLLPDKKVVDLSPLDRIPCFHLRRELFISADGNIPLCQYCRNEIVDNINDESLNDTIEKFKQIFFEHTRNRFKECCSKCDDYYTFNF